MKTKKILAMLLSLSMMATTVATMSVSANEDLANIAGTATMSTNGYDGFWPIGQANDGNVGTTAGVYGASEDTYIQADFGNAQLIKEIVVENANDHGWTGTGKARVIRLSNDANFTTYEEMVCYERVNDPAKNERWEYVDYLSKWSYEGDLPYRYVRVYAQPAMAGYTNWGDDATPCFAIKELYVYAEEMPSLTNVAGKATMSTNGNDGFWSVGQANDGNSSTTAGIYGASETSYIQADLGSAQDIKEVVVENANQYGNEGTGKARVIQLSNDPNFAKYEEMVCYNRINDGHTKTDVDYISKWWYGGESLYRYVRVYATPGAAGNTNYGTDSTPSFAIKELNLYATEKTAGLTNVLAGNVPTLTNGGAWAFSTVAESLTDGNKDSVAYSASSLAIFELDHAMDIAQVEIDLRADGEPDDPNRHYEVYLSNTGTTEGALKLLDVSVSHEKIAYNTIVLPVDSTYGYKYVLVGSKANFWGLTEVRAMSTGEYVAPDMPEEPEKEEIEITEVNMGNYAGKAWDVVINEFDGAKAYSAVFTDNEEVKNGEIGFENVEADGGSVAFAIFLHTARANVDLDVVAE